MAAAPSASGTQAVDRAVALVDLVVRADEPLSFAELGDETGWPARRPRGCWPPWSAPSWSSATPPAGTSPGRCSRCTRPCTTPGRRSPASPVRYSRPSAPRPVRPCTSAWRAARTSYTSRRWSRRTCSPRGTGTRSPSHRTAHRSERSSTRSTAFHCPPAASSAAPTARSAPATRWPSSWERCAAQRYATTVDELETGLTAIAAPVEGRDGVFAALGVSGPTARLQDRVDHIGRLLVEQSDALSALLRRRTQHSSTSSKEGAA